ncbi:ferrochelatase [Hahella sp. CCB-MM4]|uniref:ferrochelatase n=1 Tax=Hahella sp. (strain CCB-MM4) TaxID=1926491 RepID=UPI000B9B8589|nr:ferrochelatase [Hahella sp. CCB-MM4]OZG73355.1 ferrochelatase [Hahella sp. CCB-MM4]
MKFKGSTAFRHDQADKLGVLITNLGTPDAPTPAALRKYLGEFLADPRVVEIPRVLWWLILHGIILRVRPAKSAEAYKSVWSDLGSPLLVHTRDQAEALQKHLTEKGYEDLVVDFAMRYGNPSVSTVIDSMISQGVRKLLVLPLYPQYSATTSASTFDAIAQDFGKRRWFPDFRFITHYHDHDAFITAASKRIQEYWDAHGKADRLVLSYHGIPKRNLLEGDPYFCECHKTTRLLVEKLGVKPDLVLTTFQSRFGKQEWLKPYTDATLKSLPGQGVKSVQVFCPGFSADCLETIEEIGVENRDYFLEAGGERYEYISALNSRADHIAALGEIIQENLQGWSVQPNRERARKAAALGAKN